MADMTSVMRGIPLDEAIHLGRRYAGEIECKGMPRAAQTMEALTMAATELEALRKRCEAVEADAARWRHVREMTCAYGDGYTEPEECSVHLEWQQGPWIRDGSNGGAGRKDCFPGWDAIVDQMIADTAELYDDDQAIAAAQEPSHG